MKTVQESLRDGDRQSNLTVSICKVWIGWEAKLHKYWEEQFELLEARKACSMHFLEQTVSRGWTTKFVQFSKGTGWGV